MLAALCLLALATAAPSRVVVFDVRAAPELAPLAQKTTEDILLYLAKNKQVSAIAEAEVRLLVEHAQDKNEVMRCESERCLSDVSKATDADKLITGHLGRWGSGYLVTLSLVDVAKRGVERGESATSESDKDLAAALAPALDRLLGLAGEDVEPKVQFSLGAKGAKVAVLDLSAVGVPQSLADNLTQLLAIELKKVDGLSVISRDEIKAMLEYEAQKQIATCKSDTACLIEIGGALGVEYLVSGGIGKLEDTYVINLKLMDIGKAEVVHRVSESYRGPERHLNQSLRFATRALLNRPIEGSGELMISTEVDRAESKIDSEEKIILPTKLDRIAAGKHTLATSADGYYPHFQEFYVEPDATSKVRPDLVEIPSRWYEKWWPWAIIGSAVAGTITASVLIANNAPDNGGVDIVLRR